MRTEEEIRHLLKQEIEADGADWADEYGSTAKEDCPNCTRIALLKWVLSLTDVSWVKVK